MKTNKFILFFSVIVFVILGLSQTALSGGNDVFSVAGFDSDKMKKGAPVGWKLEKKKGTPVITLEKVGDRFCLHMASDSKSSFGIKREIGIIVEEYAFLNWKWKVTKLPKGGDVRKADTDDQAIQIYIAFTATGWPKKLNTPVIGYIWDNECPKDTMVTSSQPLSGKVRYVVLRNKSDGLNEWYTEKRNVSEDYKKLFPDIEGGKLRDVKGMSFYINSQHTKSEGESYIYDVYFSKN
jgi:hypothetical protein